MSKIETKLRKETIKWLDRLKLERKNLKLIKVDEKVLTNIDSYIKDCEHFLKEDILIEAFEAVIYAYGLLDMLKTLGYVEAKSHQ